MPQKETLQADAGMPSVQADRDRAAGASGDINALVCLEDQIREKEARIAALEKELASTAGRAAAAEAALAEQSREAERQGAGEAEAAGCSRETDRFKPDSVAAVERTEETETATNESVKEKEALKNELTSVLERLKTAEAGVAEHVKEAQKLSQELAASRRAHQAAIGKYVALLRTVNPEVPAEMIAGETAEQVEEALARSRRLVEQVKEALKAQGYAPPDNLAPPGINRVPPGAPGRRPLEVDGLSPREKIQLGVRKT